MAAELKPLLDGILDTTYLDGIRHIEIIEELDPFIPLSYEVCTIDDVLNPLIDGHAAVVVAGAFFGDEGKGKMTDAIARHPDIEIIMRANSGENAGHTVVHGGVPYIFHLAPSGLLTPGKTNLIGSECMMDPVSFMQSEIQQLIDAKIPYNLIVGNVHICTPYHKLIDLALNMTNNASTMKGISPIHASKVTKKGIRLDHLFGNPDIAVSRLQKDMATYIGVLGVLDINEDYLLKKCHELNEDVEGRVPAHVLGFLKAKDKTDYLMDLYRENVVENDKFPKRGDPLQMINDTFARGKKVLIECPQSYFLANKVETSWESSTSADTTADGAIAAAGYNPRANKTFVINIHKFPPSRVGMGANACGLIPQTYFSDQGISTLKDLEGVCEDFDAIQKQFWESIGKNGILDQTIYEDASGQYHIAVAMAIASARKHGERGATTLKPRILGLFDCVMHHACNLAQGPYLTISAMDRGDDYDKVGLVAAYVIDALAPEGLESKGVKYKHGDIIRPGDPLPNQQVQKHCRPIIKVMDGWRDTPIAANVRNPSDPLPLGVRCYLSEVEGLTGAEIISIGNGPGPDDLIYVKTA